MSKDMSFIDSKICYTVSSFFPRTSHFALMHIMRMVVENYFTLFFYLLTISLNAVKTICVYLKVQLTIECSPKVTLRTLSISARHCVHYDNVGAKPRVITYLL